MIFWKVLKLSQHDVVCQGNTPTVSLHHLAGLVVSVNLISEIEKNRSFVIYFEVGKELLTVRKSILKSNKKINLLSWVRCVSLRIDTQRRSFSIQSIITGKCVRVRLFESPHTHTLRPYLPDFPYIFLYSHILMRQSHRILIILQNEYSMNSSSILSTEGVVTFEYGIPYCKEFLTPWHTTPCCESLR